MPRTKAAPGQSLEMLRTFALAYPEVQEGIACEGTALEKSTFKAGNKAFLFLRAADMMVKLGDSLAEAAGLASEEPDRYKVGAHGWVTVSFEHRGFPPVDLLEKWIDESYRLIAGRKLVAMLPALGTLPRGR